jgi:hypothetical protein
MEVLTELADLRQAHVSPQTLTGYARKLEVWPVQEIHQACQNIARRPRREGETAFPALADIVSELRSQSGSNAQKDAARRNAEEIEGFFWEHVSYQMEVTGRTEQEVLDLIKVPGYTGRRARGNHEYQ